jgi:copper chaperone NosL
MTKKSVALCLLILALASFPAVAETIKCAECGMMSDLGSKFASRITEGDKPLYFCDIGDLLVYLNKHQQQAGRIEVKDYESGEWIDAQKAAYVAAPKTFSSPMGWGIAAFKDQNKAAMTGKSTDFKAALKSVK